MIESVLNTIEQNISNHKLDSCNDVRKVDKQIVMFSDEILHKVETIRNFLRDRMYQHDKVKEMTRNANKVVSFLFDLMLNNQNVCDAEGLKSQINNNDHYRIVCDFISGMTDNFAQSMYNKYL